MQRKKITIGTEYGAAHNLGLVLQGEKPTLATQFYMAYDEKGLRVRIQAEIGKPLRSAFEGEFMPVWRGDVVEIFLSPEGKEDWYYEFDFAPNGSYFHAHIYNPDNKTAYNHCLDPDHGIKGHITIEKGIWTTEMFIPYAEMNLQGKTLSEIKALPWRFNVFRYDDGNEEFCSFAPTGADYINFHIASAFADLVLE